MQILPLFSQNKVLHFNRTDARLANNGIPLDLQKLRCRVNFQALKFTPQIETLGNKLIHMLQKKGPFVALHLRYEMDMLAFSGCTHGCTEEEAEQLKQMRFVLLEDQNLCSGICLLKNLTNVLYCFSLLVTNFICKGPCSVVNLSQSYNSLFIYDF